MCFTSFMSCDSVLSALPVVMALFWPLVAAFAGKETVVWQSLVVCLYFVATDLFGRLLRHLFRTDYHPFESVANLVLLAVLFGQPYVKTPAIVIQSVGFLLTNCEPLVVFIEMRQLVRLVMALGQWLADAIRAADDDSDGHKRAVLLKASVLTGTVVAYSVAFFVIRSALVSAQTLLFTYAAILLVSFQVIQIVATVYVDEGVITVPALVFLASSFCLYLSVFEDNNKTNYNSK
ncbi:unnamed protein product [Medioppia subpectinata]|uniref:Uncharacterized protein n=1 Tax=Medioppia subpectinata TaxID=1979941 RepID=A0A7R9KT21_9ACAR|nr:unnamed protein product [Medioppia subpectinata]CAG2108985.1 unnamed protein product [Medioppia subpectinata]